MQTALQLQPRDVQYKCYELICKIHIKKELNYKLLYLWAPHKGSTSHPFMGNYPKHHTMFWRVMGQIDPIMQ